MKEVAEMAVETYGSICMYSAKGEVRTFLEIVVHNKGRRPLKNC